MTVGLKRVAIAALLLALSSPALAETRTMLNGASVTSIAAGASGYVSTSGGATTQAIGAVISAEGTLRRLDFSASNAPGAGKTYTATVYVGSYMAMTATPISCTISGTATSCRNLDASTYIELGRAWAIKVTASAGAATLTSSSYGLELDQ